MRTHTPGPWAVEEPFGPEQLAIVPAGKQTHEWVIIATCSYDDEDQTGPVITEPERNANARLIASSPDLLDALVGLVGLVELIIPTLEGSQKSAVQHNHRLDTARAVSAKATGEGA